MYSQILSKLVAKHRYNSTLLKIGTTITCGRSDATETSAKIIEELPPSDENQKPISPIIDTSVESKENFTTSVLEKKVSQEAAPPNFTTACFVEKPEFSSAILDVQKQKEDLLKVALPFDEVPGPPALKSLSKAWNYVPAFITQLAASTLTYFTNSLASNLTWSQKRQNFMSMFDKYGPIVRLHGPIGGNIVFLNRPEHIETVYKQEGKFPIRSALDSIEHYRIKHRKTHITGPFNMAGPDWEVLRTKTEVPIKKCVENSIKDLENINSELVGRIHSVRNRQEEVPPDFDKLILRWALESICLISLNSKMGCMEQDLKASTETKRLVTAFIDCTDALRKCERGLQMWRFFETKSWKNLIKNCEIIDTIVAKHIRKTELNLEIKNKNLTEINETDDSKVEVCENPDPSLLEALILVENIHPDDILTVVMDMLLIGVNAMSHALSFLLYHVSRSPRVQKEMYQEIITYLPNKDSVLSINDIPSMRYFQAVIKESLRLKPPIPILTRILPKDLAIHSYKIPKGTYILMTNHVTCLKEENFEEAMQFKPERWLKDDPDIHPFSTIPFGHGARSCLGKSIAEMQLCLVLSKIIRNYRIEYHYGEIQSSASFIALPTKPLKFRFVERVI